MPTPVKWGGYTVALFRVLAPYFRPPWGAPPRRNHQKPSMIAILESARAGLLTRKHLPRNLVAGVIVEVKGGNSARQASDRMVRAWLAEAELERTNADADVAILVTQRAGYAPARADQWWAYTTAGTLADLLDSGVMPPDPGEPVRVTLAAMLRLLRAAGYGDPITPDEVTP